VSIVVLVHGAAMDGSVWEYQADALARAGFEPITVDLPGHGASGGESSETIKGYAGWLLAYLSTMGEPVHLVGHSMGSLIVLETAGARPDLARSVTMMGTSDRMPVNPDLLAGIAGGDSSVLATMASWMYARDPACPPAWTLAETAAVLERTRPDIAHADLTACNDYPGAAAVAAAISVPMLLLLGEQDVMTKPGAAEPISKAGTDVTSVIVEGAGHLMMLERPDVVNDALLTFLRGAAE